MTRTLPQRPDLDQYRKQAKDLLRAHRAGDEATMARIKGHHPKLRHAQPAAVREAAFALADAQLVLARELGFPSWARLKLHIERLNAGEIRAASNGFYWYADQAGRIVSQLRDGGDAAYDLARRRHPELAHASHTELAARSFSLDDGRTIVARDHGFESWSDFVRHLEAIGEGPHEFATADPETASVDDQRFADAVEAIQHGRPEELARIVAGAPTLLSRRGAEGHGLLLMAAQERSRALVEVLLAAGADPNACADNGWTPLHQAAYGEPPEREVEGQRPSLEVMEALLAAGSDLTAESRGDGGTPLLQALFWGHRLLAERLAESGIVPLNLRSAAGLGRIDLLEAFFDGDGALRPEAGRHRGYAAPHAGFPDFTPGESAQEVLADALVYAGCNGRLEAVEWLLDRGANPDAHPYQETALFAAVRNGHADVVQRLLERGADVNARGDWASMTRLTALHHAASVSQIDMARLLVAAGADLDATDEVAGGTPLGWAAHFENPDIERYLSEAAASVSRAG
jgi:ankyrin repeat protein